MIILRSLQSIHSSKSTGMHQNRVRGSLRYLCACVSYNKIEIRIANEFKVDRLQIIVVVKTVLQLFISRMPKMYAIPQLVSAPLNPIPTVEHFRRSHPQCEHSYGKHIYMSEENNFLQ